MDIEAITIISLQDTQHMNKKLILIQRTKDKIKANIKKQILPKRNKYERNWVHYLWKLISFQPERFVSEMYVMVKFNINLLASEGKCLRPYKRSSNIFISEVLEYSQGRLIKRGQFY